jgi:S-adenosyl-L-methionine hydrolase (adenosine-forming)
MYSSGSIVALLTDFGSRDPYVAAMKGVIASRSRATILDLSHEIEPFDPFEAGLFLRYVRETFDPSLEVIDRPVFVAVVDPGVGTDRRILAASDEGRMFLAPDNGLLSIALGTRAVLVSVERHDLFLHGRGQTFHGRDRFAPVAAALAERVVDFEDLGPKVEREEIVSLGYREPRYQRDQATGSIISIDTFGNIITDLEEARLDLNRPFEIRIGGHSVRRIARSYAAGSGDEPFAIVGSRGTIELSMNRQSAAAVLHCGRLDEVVFRLRDKE